MLTVNQAGVPAALQRDADSSATSPNPPPSTTNDANKNAKITDDDDDNDKFTTEYIVIGVACAFAVAFAMFYGVILYRRYNRNKTQTLLPQEPNLHIKMPVLGHRKACMPAYQKLVI